MAFLQDTEEDKKASSPGLTQSSTVSSSITAQPGQRPNATQSPEASRGSGTFVDSRKYIEANKPRVEAMQQAITQDIKAGAQNLQGSLAQKQKGFESEVAKEQARIQAGGFVPETPTAGKPGVPYWQSVINKAGSGNISDEQAKQFKDILGGVGADIQGPDLSKEMSEAEKLKQRVGQFGTSEGRLRELSRTVGRQSSNYGAGQRGLDEMLLGGSQKGRVDAIRAVQKATSAIPGSLETLGSYSKEQLDKLAQARTGLSEQAKAALGEKVGGIEATIAKKQQDEQARIRNIQSRLAKGDYSALAEIPGSGVSKDQFTYGQQTSKQKPWETYGAFTPEELGAMISGGALNVSTAEAIKAMGTSGDKSLASLSDLARLGGTTNIAIPTGSEAIDRPFESVQQALARREANKSAFEKKYGAAVKDVTSVDARVEAAIQDEIKREQSRRNGGFDFSNTTDYDTDYGPSPEDMIRQKYDMDKSALEALSGKYRGEYNKELESLRADLYRQEYGDPTYLTPGTGLPPGVTPGTGKGR